MELSVTNPKPETVKPPEAPETPPVVTEHVWTKNGEARTYFASAGMLPIKNAKGETEASFYYTAYTLGSPEGDRKRPLMFSFNGGPGSSSVWLHLGGLGPRRVPMLDDGAMPPPPYEVINNEHAWLGETDLVFIDPVDTGYSRATSDDLTKQFLEVKKDLDAIGEFIRLYLTRSKRWSSPLYLVGESYGTFRAAGLAGLLIDKGIAFNGIVLVSSILNLLSASFDEGNDLPYSLFLPTYAATAWFHGKLPTDQQSRDLEEFLSEVEAFASGDYVVALAQGHALSGEARASIVDRLAAYTGLAPDYIQRSNLRIEIQRFCKELRRADNRTVGRLDSRYTGHDQLGVTGEPDFDPSMSAIRPPFTAALNDYLRRELGYENDNEYHILRGLDWNWGNARDGYAKTQRALGDAFARNPYLHLFIASGYYDLATPYFATDYTVNQLSLAQGVRDQITIEKYPVGHMVYLEINVLKKLQEDVAAFIAGSISPAPRPLT